MSTILTNFGSGGANLTPAGSSGSPDLATTLRDAADDLATFKAFCNSLRTAYNATLAKLDADAGVTDTNYAATNPAPAAIGTLLTIKG
jgi:hypothetical protein